MKRTALKRVGARKKREMKELQRFRIEVLKAAGFACERCGGTQDLHAHHRLTRARGGLHHPDNGHCLCMKCHDGVHLKLDDWRRWLE